MDSRLRVIHQTLQVHGESGARGNGVGELVDGQHGTGAELSIGSGQQGLPIWILDRSEGLNMTLDFLRQCPAMKAWVAFTGEPIHMRPIAQHLAQ
jgi:hypothetical protein